MKYSSPNHYPAEIKRINRQLIAHFGIETESMNPMWRLSWSDDQYEKRKSKFSPSGIELLYPMEFLFPKYQWVKERWILENLVLVPEQSQEELCGIRKSYECMWNFSGSNEEYIEPVFRACKMIVDCVHAAKGKVSLGAKYVDPMMDQPEEKREAEINQLMEELFGDESFLLGRTVTGEAIAMPANYKKENE